MILIASAGSGLGLSCMRYGVTDAYRAAAQSDAAYVVVRGTLRFDAEALPKSHQEETPERTIVKAEIEGVALGPGGRREARVYEVRLEVYCSGQWCARPRTGDALAFLRKAGRRYILVDEPCGAFLFNRPRPEDMSAIQACLDGRPCPASLPR